MRDVNGARSLLSNGVFHRLTTAELGELLNTVTTRRRITSIHLHHTWRPRRADFAGVRTIIAMWKYHTEVQRWIDIAQHLTVDPEGRLWTGRHWDLPPASASGHNGTEQAGPFMIEMIGDFDPGCDPFDDPQRREAIVAMALLARRFALQAADVRFHREMSPKTCPGQTIDQAELRTAVQAAIDAAPPLLPDLPSPFSWGKDEDAISRAVEFLKRSRDAGAFAPLPSKLLFETRDAEPVEAEDSPVTGAVGA